MKIIKRIILFLAIVLSVLWIEITHVHADMSAPELRQFEVVVTNPDGVDYYDYKNAVAGHLNKDEKAVVMYEYDGKYTIGSYTKNSYGNHEQIGYVYSLDDFNLVQEEVDPTKTTEGIIKLEKPAKARVYSEDGVDIYAGPSTVYKKVGHIKNNEILTYKYIIDGISGMTNIYIDYNGVKGWVEILKGKVLIENDSQYIFANELKTDCGTIERNSVITPNFKTDNWTHKVLIEYNGCETLINSFRDDDIYYVYQSGRVTSKEESLYKYADSSSEVLDIIPSGSEITSMGCNDFPIVEQNICYVKYGDVTGWIIDDEYFYDNNAPASDDEPVEIEDTIEQEEVIIPNSQVDIKPSMSLAELIVLCSMGGVLLVITAIVVIILINKSKKNKGKETPLNDNKKEK